MKPFSESCERNKKPIYDTIKPWLSKTDNLLEIGSGTGQHACYFARLLTHIQWQTSDLKENHEGINLWLREACLTNLLPPVSLNVNDEWPETLYDVIYSANTTHIMSWESVCTMFRNVSQVLNSRGLLILYGPFNYNQQYTSPGNQQFDVWLKSVNPDQGIRDFEAINQLAKSANLSLLKDYDLPANNRVLIWQKIL